MKEKILNYLKQLRKEDSSISDRTLDDWATIEVARITEDSQLTQLDVYKPLIASFEGNIRFIAAEAVKNLPPATPAPPATPPVIPTIPPQPNIPNPEDLAKTIQDAVAIAVAPLQEKINGFEKSKSVEQIRQDVQSKINALGYTDSNKFLADKDFNELQGSFEDADSMYKAWESKHNETRAGIGVGIIEPKIAGGGGSTNEKGGAIAKGFKERMVAEGKIPKEE